MLGGNWRISLSKKLISKVYVVKLVIVVGDWILIFRGRFGKDVKLCFEIILVKGWGNWGIFIFIFVSYWVRVVVEWWRR